MSKPSPPGLFYEVLVGNWLATQGYKTRIRQRSRKLGEADIIATKGTFRKKFLFVECKDKMVVSLADFHKFVSKFSKFSNSKPKARGLLVYSGKLSADVKDYYNKTLDKGLRERVELVRKTREQLRQFTKLKV
jgi:hypothetical protein